MKYYVYILRCLDMSLYTGSTNNIEKRYEKHIAKKGAKYTKIKGVLKIELIFLCENKSEALKTEYYIKKLSKINKEKLIIDPIIYKEKFGYNLTIKYPNEFNIK